MIDFVYNDGGRSDAGYRGDAGDCVVRAIAIAKNLPYQYVYDVANDLAQLERPRKQSRSSARNGITKATTRALMDNFGGEWTPTMQIGSGCRVHLTEDELPDGIIIVNLSKHVCAVIDRVVHDTYLDDRNGTRCVYGYWSFEHVPEYY